MKFYLDSKLYDKKLEKNIFYKGNPENTGTFTYKGNNIFFSKSLFLNLNYDLFYRGNNFYFYGSLSEEKEKKHLNNYLKLTRENSENFKEKFILENIVEKLKKSNFDLQKYKHKYQLEYHSKFLLFTDNFGITYKPGFYIQTKSHKNSIFADKELGLSLCDVFGRYQFIFGFSKKSSSDFREIFEKEINKYNKDNPLFAFNYEKKNEIKNGIFIKFFERYPIKEDLQTVLGIDLSMLSFLKDTKASFYFGESLKNQYDYFFKLKAIRVSPDNFNDVDKDVEFKMTNELKHLHDLYMYGETRFILKFLLNQNIIENMNAYTKIKICSKKSFYFFGGFNYTFEDRNIKNYAINLNYDSNLKGNFDLKVPLREKSEIVIGIGSDKFKLSPYFNLIYSEI